MVLRIDSRIPVVWRDPHSLQFGVTAPRAVLEAVTEVDERLISALRSGVSRAGLDVVAEQSGGTAADAASILDRVRPALEDTTDAPPPAITVCGGGPTARALATDLAARGVRVVLVEDADGAARIPCELAVIVTRYVVPPEFHGLFLRRDLPHLAVVVGDEHVDVSPVVEPGAGPCLHCLHRHHTDADAAWPAIATQLWGRPAADESALIATEAAAVVTRIVLSRLEDGPAREHRSVRLAVATGARSEREWAPHPECGCISTGGASAAPALRRVSRPRRGSDSVAAFHPTRRTVRPTTGRDAGERA